jgi:hypothetical protein
MAKVFNDIGRLASSNINFINGTIEKGPGFFWDDMFKILDKECMKAG